MNHTEQAILAIFVITLSTTLGILVSADIIPYDLGHWLAGISVGWVAKMIWDKGVKP